MKTFSVSLAALLPIALVNAQATTDAGTPSSTGSSSGSVQTVQVGQGGLVFEPDSITANEGDVIAFVIHTTHNVARSSFDSPCQPISGAQSIWSGDDLDDGTVFSVTINDTSPIWLYCATGQHCQDGMAMVINPGDGSETISAYQSAASRVANTGTPEEIAGGVYGEPSGDSDDNNDDNGDDSSSTSSDSSSMSSTMTGSPSTGPTGASTTTSSAPTTTTSNAASNLMADMMMVGGAVLGGAVLIM